MKKLIIQFSKFVIIGGLSFILDFALYYVFTRYLNIIEMVAQIMSFSISVIFNYMMSMKYVFVSKDDLKKHHEFMIFITLSALGALLNWIIFYIMFYVLGIDDLITKVIDAGIVMFFNFITRKFFLEKKETTV